MPKMILLSPSCDKVVSSQHLDALPNPGRDEQKPQFGDLKVTGRPKQLEIIPVEGSVTTLYITDTNGIDPELFVGYESGAIGMFRLQILKNKNGEMQIHTIKLFSAQKLIQDLKVKHVLSFSVTHFSEESEDFKLAIGYYSNLMQTIDFTSGYKNNSYTMVDQHITDQSYHEKPGIGCLTSLTFGKKAILVSGGFDHRIKVVSLKTLKPLVQLQFHQGIVNQIQVKKLEGGDGEGEF